MNQIWSWVLTAVGVFGLYLAGRKSKAGWAVGFGAQTLWIAYAIATRQWGFIVSAFAYGTVYARNWLRWRRESAPQASAKATRPRRRGGYSGGLPAERVGPPQPIPSGAAPSRLVYRCRGGDGVRRDSDTDEIEAMTCAVHQLICVPLVAPAWHHYDQHQGPDPDDDVACRSRARFLVESLHIGGWQVTEIAPVADTESGSAHTTDKE